MRTYGFSVEGLPPKKSGARSMWANDMEAERVHRLRVAANGALEGAPPLREPISLTVKVSIPKSSQMVGDLDPVVAGGAMGVPALVRAGLIERVL